MVWKMDVKKSPAQFVVALLLLALGLTASIYLTHLFWEVRTAGGETVDSFCAVSDTINCVTVEQSDWAVIFNVPVAIYGLEYYSLGLLILLLSYFGLWPWRQWRSLVFWLAAASLPFIVFLFILATFVIRSICLVCCAVYLVNISLFVYLLVANRKNKRELLVAGWRETGQLLAGRHAPRVIMAVAVLAFASQFFWMSLVTPGSAVPTVQSWKGLTVQGRSVGPLDAPVQIEEFTDFQCPFCGKAHHVLMQLLEKYPGQIRLTHRDFPLDQACNPYLRRPFHRDACRAAIYTRCAERQGKFWPMDELVFSNRHRLRKSDLDGYAEQLNLNNRAFRECLKDPKIKTAIRADLAEGRQLQIRGTPAIFVNGEKVEGYRPLEFWVEKVESILHRAESETTPTPPPEETPTE